MLTQYNTNVFDHGALWALTTINDHGAGKEQP